MQRRNPTSQEKAARSPRDSAAAIFRAGLQAVDPEVCIRKWLRVENGRLMVGRHEWTIDDGRNIYIAGIGKASAAMAGAVEEILQDRITEGLIITKYHHGKPLARCRVMEAGHPVPDENGVKASEALIEMVRAADVEDIVICLISGGGSALSPAPAEPVTLEDKRNTTRLLLHCGATIHEINTIRKHLSRIKGGQLCRHAGGAKVISLILSDVIGDDMDIIASGLTAPDTGTFGQCMEIIKRYGLLEKIPKPVVKRLAAGAEGGIAETPKADDPLFDNVINQIVGSNSDALDAAEKEARRLGLHPVVLSSTIRGEAREAAKFFCAVLEEVHRSGRPAAVPACILSGGETTVTIVGSGKGGRNMEMALAAAIELEGKPGVVFLSAGTDGTDGPTDAAGAFADGEMVERARAKGLPARRFLADNDSYHFFRETEDLFITGPTGTNVMDLQIMLCHAL